MVCLRVKSCAKPRTRFFRPSRRRSLMARRRRSAPLPGAGKRPEALASGRLRACQAAVPVARPGQVGEPGGCLVEQRRRLPGIALGAPEHAARFPHGRDPDVTPKDIEETQGIAPNFPMIGDPDLAIFKLYEIEAKSPNISVLAAFQVATSKRLFRA